MLKAKITSSGRFLGLPVPALAEVIGRTGFDFLILDGEHGYFSPERIEECLRASDSVNLPTIVRIPEINSCHIQAALDAGARGVQVPAVETAKQARTIVEASHFPPHGKRGFGSTTRAAGYGFIPRSDVTQRAEDSTVVIQIETRCGVENLTEILAVDGIDMVFIGTSDLSLDYGYSSPADPAMLPLLHQTIRNIRGAGKACGLHIADLKSIPQMKELGVRCFTVSALAIIGQSLRKLVHDFGEELKK